MRVVFSISRVLTLLLALWALTVRAQQDVAPAVSAIGALGRMPSDADVVRVRGVVTGIEAARFFVQDATGGIPVVRTSAPADLATGEVCEIFGTLTGQGGGKELQPTQIVRDGVAKLPAAQRVRSFQLSSGGAKAQRVRLTGTVHEVGINAGAVIIQIESEGVSLVASWPRVKKAGESTVRPPEYLLDAVVEVSGVAPTPLNLPGLSRALRLVVAHEQDVRVLRQGSPDPFSRPLLTLGELAHAKLNAGERRRVRGTVNFWSDAGWFFLQDETGTLRVDNAHLLPQTIGWPYRAGRSQPDLQPGDVVEVVGQPLQIGTGRPAMSQCEWRVVGKADPPPFVPMNATEVAAGAVHATAVSVTGYVTDVQVSIDYMGFANHMLWMQSGDVVFSALVQRRKPEPVPVKAGDYVRLEGVVSYSAGTASRTSAFRVNLNGFEDIHPAKAPVILLDRQMRQGLLIVGIVVALPVIWIVLLRRQVKAQTAQLRANAQQLQAQLVQEKELGEMKSRFVFTVSHEFRNPLAAILSCSDVLQRMRDKLTPEEYERQIGGIQQNVHRMADMMEEVLLLGRAEAGRLPCEPQPVELRAFCLKLSDQIRSASDQRCPIQLDIAPDLPRLMLDPAMLQHILGNLISNAVKYSPAGMSVEVSAAFDGEIAVFTIQDHGVGIPTLDRPLIFEPFQRGSNVGDTAGTGLGLAIAERCARAHGGSIECRSNADEGTTFTVRIPCKATAEDQTP